MEHGCAFNDSIEGFTETRTNLDCLNGIGGASGSLVSQVVIPTSYSSYSVGPHCDIAQTTDINIGSGPTTAPMVAPDGSVYMEIETSQSTETTVCDTNGITSTSSTAASTSLMQIFPGGGMGLQTVSSGNAAGNPSDVIPDGNGGVLASAGSSDGGLIMTDIGPGGTTQAVFSNVGTSGTPASSMVLGDNNTAFATDGITVVALDATSLQQKWSYASTGGFLSFVAATSGGGVTINDSQQGVIQLDSSGNAGAPVASLQDADYFGSGLWLAQTGDPVLGELDGNFIFSAISSWAFPAGSNSGARTQPKFDVQKPYNKNLTCSVNAQGVISAVTANFYQFGDYSGLFGPYGVPVALATVSFGEIPVTQGATISITDVNTSPGLGNTPNVQVISTAVTVRSVSANSFTFDTVPGHVLYPASITFSASDIGSGHIGFSIQVQGDFAGAVPWALYHAGGSNLEDKIWNNLIDNVQKFCTPSH